ncbi:MAG: HAMP domain-containing histidine kinase [Oscillospiraceae bacterium]|nr:HAMP domain-containing histidine kinase [Oscillospiraceae bacterium]
MDISNNIIALLEQLPQPVFLVKDDVVVYANHAAQLRDVQEKTNVYDLITIGHQEYQQFISGKLILTVSVAGILYNTVVTNSGEYHLFCLESEYSKPELRAFAVAAQALRDPLSNAFLRMDKLLPDPTVQDSPALLAQIKAINRNIHQIYRAVQNMSDAATVGSAACTETRDVVAFLAELVEKANALFAGTRHHIEFQPMNRPAYCSLNPGTLERAILNLVSNAAKYASGDGVIKISLRAGANKLYICVQSDCEHPSAHIKSNIFSGFIREPSIDDNNRGIGLGLRITHSIAASHKGTLLVEQSDDTSLRFTLSLSTTLPEVVKVNSPVMITDKYGGFDPFLIELAEVLPSDLYE